MQAINGALTFLFDVLLLEFLGLPPFWELASISILFGFVALLVFKKISNQKGIRAAKDKIVAHLLEIILYQNDVRVVFRAQGKVLRYNVAYLGYNSIPMVVLVIPFIFVVMNLDPRYRFDPIQPGRAVNLTVTLREGVSFDGLRAELEGPEEVRVETPAIRVPGLHTVDWRVRPMEAGVFTLEVRINDELQEKRLVVGDHVKMLAPKREGGNPLFILANPGELPIPKSSPIKTVQLSYQRTQTIPVLGIDMHWIVVFLIVSLGFGFAIKGLMGVEI